MITSLQISKFGGPEVLTLIDETASPLLLDSVRIRVTAIGVNFADIVMRMGMYPEAPRPPFVPGYEIAGVITEVGAAVKSVHPGDRVLAGTKFGGYRSETVLPETQVRRIPPGLSDEEAAGIPVNFLTAWVALHEMARVRKKDRVLIHSAAGGVGVAAIQMAAQAGAHVTGLVSSKQKAEALYGLGLNEALTYEEWEDAGTEEGEEEFGKYSIILDSSGGQNLKRGFQRLSSSGRIINFGVASLVSGEKRSLTKIISLFLHTPIFTPFKLMMENKGVFGLNMLQLFNHPEIIMSAMDQILERFKDKSFRVLIGKTFPLAQGGAAHSLLQSRTNTGKVILIPPSK